MMERKAIAITKGMQWQLIWLGGLLCCGLVQGWSLFQKVADAHPAWQKQAGTPFSRVRSAMLHFSSKGDSESKQDVEALVIGGGLSGSTAAFYLQRMGVDVVLAEARDTVGGNIITSREDGFQWEEGPNSFQPNKAMMRFARDLGLAEELVFADPGLPRFVYWNNKLHALPSSFLGLLKFSLLSLMGKIRAALGILGLVRPPPAHEESVQEWATRHLGEEAFERIVDPFVSGVYAGDPSRLSMQASMQKMFTLEQLGLTRGILEGAIVRAMQLLMEKKDRKKRGEPAEDADIDRMLPPAGTLGSFRDGMQTPLLEIQRQLGSRIRLSHQLHGLRRTEDQCWEATFRTQHGTQTLRAKAVVLTLPAYALADVLEKDMPSLQAVRNVHYPPVAAVVVSYPDTALRQPAIGFGHLIPRAAQLRTLGSIWASSLFPGRVPPGQVLLVNFIGGAQDEGVASLTKTQLAQQVHDDLCKVLLKPQTLPPKVLGVRLWPRAIPQYNIGHREIVATVKRVQASQPGLYFGGNYLTGVAIGDCVQFGTNVAKEVADFVRRS